MKYNKMIKLCGKIEPMIKMSELLIKMTQTIKMYLYPSSFHSPGISNIEGQSHSDVFLSNVNKNLPSGRITNKKIKNQKKLKNSKN